jgi:hypothetical protein
MSATRRTRLPVIVGMTFWKSFTYGTSGFTTTTNVAPASTATSMFVVERMPPSISWRPFSSTGL